MGGIDSSTEELLGRLDGLEPGGRRTVQLVVALPDEQRADRIGRYYSADHLRPLAEILLDLELART